MSDSAKPPESDAERLADALARYRDVAKWIIGAVAAVAVALTAGLGLSSLGKLEGVNLGLAIAAAIVVLIVVAAILLKAAAVLRPESVRIDEISSEELAYLNRLGFETLKATNGDQLQQAQVRILQSGLLSDAEVEAWRSQRRDMGAQIAFRRIQTTFDATITEIVKLAAIGAIAVGVFAFASTEEGPDSPATSALPPKPVAATISLSTQGKDAFRSLLGEECVDSPIEAIAIGGSESNPLLITTPSGACALARVTLTSDLGTVEAATAAAISPD